MLYNSRDSGVWGEAGLSSVLMRASSLDVKEPAGIDVIQWAIEERQKRLFEEMPVLVWETSAAKDISRADRSKQYGFTTSKILGHVKVELNLIAVVPSVPSNFPDFHDERSCAALSCISVPKPDEVSFLHSSPCDCYIANPFNLVLGSPAAGQAS